MSEPWRRLKSQRDWNWTKAQSEAFQKIKQTLTSTPLVRYFDVHKPLSLSVDASRNEFGAAIIQDTGTVAVPERNGDRISRLFESSTTTIR